MIEARRDLELPSVQDGDSQAVPKLAEIVLSFVGGEIPGIGIDHTNVYAQSMTHRQVHQYHQNLILQAAEIVRPEIDIDSEFRGIGDVREQPHLPFHPDKPVSFDGKQIEASFAGFPVHLRLHTADAENGAHVLMANSRPGVDRVTARDNSVLLLRGELKQKAINGLGYDAKLHESGARVSDEVVLGVRAGATGIDGSRSSGDVYEYSQYPLSSVFFRSRAALGPATLHGFQSLDAQKHRTFIISDINAYSQAL